MSLFFDADWFDARLAERGLGRSDLAVAAGVDRAELHRLFTNARAPSGAELNAFAALLGVDLVEISLRCGVASRETAPGADPAQRIDSIEERLNAVDEWLERLEAQRKRA